MPSYKSSQGFFNNLERIHAEIEHLDNIFFIAHSLGGIYALHLADKLRGKVRAAVTLSTPYGGSQGAQVAQMLLPLYNPQLMADIAPNSGPISQSRAIEIHCPWTNLVTISGNSSLMMAANDGVVTEASMRSRSDMRLVDVNANHYEIVMSHEALNVIKSALKAA